METVNGSAAIYEIRLGGRLPEYREVWFEGMTFTYDDAGHTILTGPVADQAALHGLLDKIRDLGIPLLSVNQI